MFFCHIQAFSQIECGNFEIGSLSEYKFMSKLWKLLCVCVRMRACVCVHPRAIIQHFYNTVDVIVVIIIIIIVFVIIMKILSLYLNKYLKSTEVEMYLSVNILVSYLYY